MNAVEEIQTAIDRLTELKAESTPTAWGGHQNILGLDRIRTTDGYIVAEVYGDDSQEANAELIVTLHRTIDAQIAILRHAIEEPHNHIGEWRLIDNDAAVLAEAINGGTR